MTTITTELAQRIAAISDLKAGYQLGYADVVILQEMAGALAAKDTQIAEMQRQLIAPLPIGELLQRLSDQTGENWGAKYLEVARPEQQPVVTDDMALVFHAAITDGSIGSDDVEEIKTGLRAALAHYSAPAALPATAITAERVWETAMMEVCGEDTPGAVASEIRSLRSLRDRAMESLREQVN